LRKHMIDDIRLVRLAFEQDFHSKMPSTSRVKSALPPEEREQSHVMKATLEIINQMQKEGIIGRYAIGGAVGAAFYLEPVATLDIDIFVSLKKPPDADLLSLTPIYDYLTLRGYRT